MQGLRCAWLPSTPGTRAIGYVTHRVRLIEGFSVQGMWTGVCLDCQRVVGDDPSKEVVQLEAEEHERNPDPPKLEPWHPGKHPTPNR